jgi:hypothetical protein
VTGFVEDGTTEARQGFCVKVSAGNTVEVDSTSAEPLVFDGALVVLPD